MLPIVTRNCRWFCRRLYHSTTQPGETFLFESNWVTEYKRPCVFNGSVLSVFFDIGRENLRFCQRNKSVPMNSFVRDWRSSNNFCDLLTPASTCLVDFASVPRCSCWLFSLALIHQLICCLSGWSDCSAGLVTLDRAWWISGKWALCRDFFWAATQYADIGWVFLFCYSSLPFDVVSLSTAETSCTFIDGIK